MLATVFFAVFAVVSSGIAEEKEERLPDFSNSFEELQFPLFDPMPYLPFRQMMVPDWSNFLPWYKGPHVCSSNRVLDKGHEKEHWTANGFQGSPDKMEISSETCTGDDQKYVCMKRAESQEGPKMIMTKYECCPGFFRHPYDEPGCVKRTHKVDDMKPIEIAYIRENAQNWKTDPKSENASNEEADAKMETASNGEAAHPHVETATPNVNTTPPNTEAAHNLVTALNKEIAPSAETVPNKETAHNMEATSKEGTTLEEKSPK